MGIPNPGAIRSEINALESQKGEVISKQKEQLQGALSELYSNKAQIQAKIIEFQKGLSSKDVPPQVRSQITEQLSVMKRQKAKIENQISRYIKQRSAVEIRIATQFNPAIEQRRKILARLAGMKFNQAVGDELKGTRKG